MATVEVLSKERMLEIEANSIVDANLVGDNLVLTTHGGDDIDVGSVRGSMGGRIICTSTTRPGSSSVGQEIYETDTRRVYVWVGSVWGWRWVIGAGPSPYLAELYHTAAFDFPIVIDVLHFDHEAVDTAGVVSSGIYSCPIPARYKVDVGVLVQIATSGATPLISLGIGGVETRRLAQVQPRGATVGDSFFLTGSTEINVNAGTSIELLVASGGAVTPIYPGQPYCWMNIDVVGYY